VRTERNRSLAEQVSPVQFTAKLVQLELNLLLMLPKLGLESDGPVDPADLRLRPACEREGLCCTDRLVGWLALRGGVA
jgi:hypothetical protein